VHHAIEASVFQVKIFIVGFGAENLDGAVGKFLEIWNKSGPEQEERSHSFFGD